MDRTAARTLRLFLAALLALVPLTVTACDRAVPRSPLETESAVAAPLPQKGDAGSPPPTAFVQANNAFAWRLFDAMTARDDRSDRNLAFSPFSIASALGMLANGAEGATAQEIERALGVEPGSLSESNAHYANALAALPSALSGGDQRLEIANSLWLQQATRLRPDFAAANRDYYAAGLERVDFRLPDAKDRINQWVAARTGGNITELFERLDPATVLVLANAMYMKATWATPFDPEETLPGTFLTASGNRIQVPTLHAAEDSGYHEDDRVQAVRLPYLGDALAMYVILPKKGRTLADARAFAAARPLAVSAFATRSVVLSLPKFDVQGEPDLQAALIALGVERTFDPERAQFGRILETQSSQLWLDQTMHKATVTADETGTVATSATGLTMTMGIATEPPESVVMRADRPFLAVVATAEGLPLFVAEVRDPSVK